MQLASEAEFQRAYFKLRDRECKYFFEANKDQLGTLPYLEDLSGGLSNRTYFGFVYYTAWKAACAYLATAEQQDKFSAAFGDALLEGLAPDAVGVVQRAARQSGAP